MMSRSLLILAVTVLVVLVPRSYDVQAQQNASALTSFTYIQVPDGPSPCIDENRANGINQRGDIAGRCKDNAGNPRSWVLPQGKNTPILIDFSAAPFTPTFGSTTRAINARGDIAGRY